MHDDGGAAGIAFIETVFFRFFAVACDFFDIVRVRAVARPVPNFSGRIGRFPRVYVDFFCRHKCRIKADAELPDERRIFRRRFVQFFKKRFRAAARDRAEVIG